MPPSLCRQSRTETNRHHIDSSRLCVRNQPLNARALEIRSRVAVVDVRVDLVPAPFPDIPLEQELLRSDLSRIISPLLYFQLSVYTTITQIVKSIAIHTLIITVVDYTRYFRRKVLNQKEISLKGQYVR